MKQVQLLLTLKEGHLSGGLIPLFFVLQHGLHLYSTSDDTDSNVFYILSSLFQFMGGKQTFIIPYSLLHCV